MNPLYSGAQDLVNAARNLMTELESLEAVPSALHIAAIQEE